MSTEYRSALIDYVKTTPATNAGARLVDLSQMISTSAQFALQQ